MSCRYLLWAWRFFSLAPSSFAKAMPVTYSCAHVSTVIPLSSRAFWSFLKMGPAGLMTSLGLVVGEYPAKSIACLGDSFLSTRASIRRSCFLAVGVLGANSLPFSSLTRLHHENARKISIHDRLMSEEAPHAYGQAEERYADNVVHKSAVQPHLASVLNVIV